jgi:hypothetical protein
MVRDAIAAHAPFNGCNLSVYAKGSYPNNTNVQADSDVDIAVQCHEVFYWDNAPERTSAAIVPYTGVWTPGKLRSEVVAALRAKFPAQVDTSGSTAVTVHSSSARVDADVVPCFDYRYYDAYGTYRDGTKVFPVTGPNFINYPAQHLANGRAKNTSTNGSFKKAVRILKRVENLMLANDYHRAVPSYFVECLVYNCPNSILNRSTWMSAINGVLVHIWEGLQGDAEPDNDDSRWLEVNDCKYLFHPTQKWSRKDGRDFAYAAWNYLGFGA